jgi:hypothetical protein
VLDDYRLAKFLISRDIADELQRAGFGVLIAIGNAYGKTRDPEVKKETRDYGKGKGSKEGQEAGKREAADEDSPADQDH